MPLPTEPAGPAAAPAAHLPHTGRALLLFLCGTALVVLAGLALLLWDAPLAGSDNPQTLNAYIDGDRTAIAAHVQGYIRLLPITDNQRVRAGDTIAEIDDADYRAQLAQAEAQVNVAAANLRALDDKAATVRSQIAEAAAAVDAARAGLFSTGPDAARQRALEPTDAGLRRGVDVARAAARVSRAGIARAQAQFDAAAIQLDVLRAQRREAEAALAARRADVSLAAISLGWTRIAAPIDGTLGVRAVRPGSLVSPGTAIVQVTPLDGVWVTANFTERQIAGIVPGRPARLRIDAYPDTVLAGHVVGLAPGTGATFSSVAADNTTGNYTKVVQRVPVKIAIDWQGSRLRGLLRPGMSLTATVLTRDGAAP